MMRKIALVCLLAAVPLWLASPAMASVDSPSNEVAASPTADFNETGLAKATQNSSFGGYRVDNAAHTVTVYATADASNAELDSVKALALPEGYTLSFSSVTRSWADLADTQANLPKLLPAVLRPLLTEAVIDPASNGLDVSLSSIPASAQELVKTAFGSLNVALSVGEPFNADAAGQTRLNEGSDGPWHGGARIAVSAAGSARDGCTAGFVIQIAGVNYGTTAGHCGAGGGNSVVQGWTTGHIIGAVKHRSYVGSNPDSDWDTEYYNGDLNSNGGGFSSAIWITNSSGRQIKGDWTPGANSAVCASGSYSGNGCTTSHKSSGVCASVDGYYTCHMGSMGNPGVCTDGDSGGPVYADRSNLIYAVGDIVGSNSSECVYTTIGAIEDHWGGTTITG